MSNSHPLEEELSRFETYVSSRGGDRSFKVAAYRAAIRPTVDYYRTLQDERGAIIDPHFEMEWHYSTPSFALAAALLAAAGEEEYIEPAVHGLTWSATLLSEGRTPQQHADFFTIKLMHAHSLLEPLVGATVSAEWKAKLAAVDPYRHYQFTREKKSPEKIHNWNALALAGEQRRLQAGLTASSTFVEEHVEFHLARFNECGFYRDGESGRLDESPVANPMAYDLVARSALGDLVEAGYGGSDGAALERRCLDGALSALFFQDPNGEYPAIGRSGHHIWNEAYLAFTAEWAAKRLKTTRPALAAALRRAAELALLSMEAWRRDDGSFFTVKNRFAPAERQGFEVYTVPTTYNLWAVAGLAMAAIVAEDTVDPSEVPAEGHHYALYSGSAFYRHVAAAKGHFLLYDSCPEVDSDPIGLSRVVRRGFRSELGPGQGAVANPRYSVMKEGAFLSHAPGWVDRFGGRHELPALGTTRMVAAYMRPYVPQVTTESEAGWAKLTATWRGGFGGAALIESVAVVSADGVALRHRVEGVPRRLNFP